MGVELLSPSQLVELVLHVKTADRRVSLCQEMLVVGSHDGQFERLKTRSLSDTVSKDIDDWEIPAG